MKLVRCHNRYRPLWDDAGRLRRLRGQARRECETHSTAERNQALLRALYDRVLARPSSASNSSLPPVPAESVTVS